MFNNNPTIALPPEPYIITLYYSMLYKHEPYWANVTLCVDE